MANPSQPGPVSGRGAPPSFNCVHLLAFSDRVSDMGRMALHRIRARESWVSFRRTLRPARLGQGFLRPLNSNSWNPEPLSLRALASQDWPLRGKKTERSVGRPRPTQAPGTISQSTKSTRREGEPSSPQRGQISLKSGLRGLRGLRG